MRIRAACSSFRATVVRSLSVALLLMGPALPSRAQETGIVTGLVTSASGRPLPAAQVYISGTGVGALTNEAGHYLLLDAPVGEHEIRVLLVGYREESRTVTVSAGTATLADFMLTWSAIGLEEIVVTGTGQAVERRRLGNTVATVDAAAVADAPITNLSELLQAREPSVVGLTSDGAVGSGARLRIRGSNSLSMSNEPVVYVDGLRVDNAGDNGRFGRGGDGGSRLDDINWEAVERVEILKGAAAATLYGSEASSGIIQIFTKAGRPGQGRFTVRVDGGLSVTPDVIPPNAGFARDADEAARLSEMYRLDLEPFEVFERDFMGDMLERGSQKGVSADVSGGSDEVHYYVAARYFDEDGTLGAQELGGARDIVRRVQVNTSVTFLPRERLTLRVTTGFSDVHLETFQRNNNVFAPLTTVVAAKPEDAQCDASALDETRMFGKVTPLCTGAGNPWGSWGFGTPREMMQYEWDDDTQHLTGSASLSWSGQSGLSVQASGGLDQVNTRTTSRIPFGWGVDGVSRMYAPQGFRFIGDRSHRELTFDSKAGWSTGFGGGDFSSDLTAGGQAFLTDDRLDDAVGIQFPAPGVEVVQAGEVTQANDSWSSKVSLGTYLQEQVGYRDWLFGTVGARFDRTSAFGREAGSAFYPKASVSAILTDIPLMDLSWLSTLRLRAAYGQSGLQPGTFDKLTTYTTVQTPTGGGLAPDNIGNALLKPERAREMEVGLDAELLRGRVGLDVTYWDRTTTDALITRQFPTAGGFTASQLDNIGRLDAHGLEIRLNALVLDRPGLALNLFANGAYLSEVITSMGGAPMITASSPAYTRHRNALVEGFTPGSHFGAQLIPVCGPGVERTCYTPGSTVPFDTNGDGIPDSLAELQAFLTSMDAVPLGNSGPLAPLLDDEDGDGDLYDHYLGKPYPDWQGSFGFELTFKERLTVNAMLEYRGGSYSVSNLGGAFRNSTFRNVRKAAEVESTLLNPATRSDVEARTQAALTWAEELVALYPYSGVNMVEPGDFIRWRELSVTYRIPEGWAARFGARNASVSLSGRNLFLWTRYGGVEPEGNELSRCGGAGEAMNGVQCNFLEAVEVWNLPLPRRITMSVRVGL